MTVDSRQRELVVGSHRRRQAIAAFLVFCICGMFGVLYDLDHVVDLWVRGISISLDNLLYKSRSTLHIPIVLVCMLGCFIYHAYMGRRNVGRTD